ncbi:MAG: FHA domain-containing protein [Acidobacteria bacterium]|nr:FHA domain-containing protein [Acidobacteriota bacterium]
MTQIRLIYIDEEGYEQTVLAGADPFTIGRLPSCDLSIQDERISREHCRIERSGKDVFVDDLGSSNGTTLNGNDLNYRSSLYNGDVLNLGGLEIIVRIEAAEQAAPVDSWNANAAQPISTASEPASVSVSAASSSGSSSSFPWIFLIAPVMAVIVLTFVGGIFLVLNSGSDSNRVQISDKDDIDDITTNRRSGNDKKEDPTPRSGPSPDATQTPSGTSSPMPSQTVIPSGSPTDLSANAKIEHNAAIFLRKIGENDPKAFLTSEQAGIVGQKIKQISGNPALAANLASARQQSARFNSLVSGKNIKPGFLAIAAVNRLGSSRGDVAKTAESLLPVIEKLYLQIGAESADDAILMIAAYDQGAAGETMKMRNLLQGLANKFPVSTREMRSIWFLKKQNLISDTDFDRALTFLAIGTISQNPKDFGVNTEPLGY